MERAKVLDYSLQTMLQPYMQQMKPRPSIYYSDFIAANQAERADNIIQGTKWNHLRQIRADIRDFKQSRNLDKVCSNTQV